MFIDDKNIEHFISNLDSDEYHDLIEGYCKNGLSDEYYDYLKESENKNTYGINLFDENGWATDEYYDCEHEIMNDFINEHTNDFYALVRRDFADEIIEDMKCTSLEDVLKDVSEMQKQEAETGPKKEDKHKDEEER